MISDIAWENILWLKESYFERMDQIGGKLIEVESFRPYLKRTWIKRLKPETARRILFIGIEKWAAEVKTVPLTTVLKLDNWKKGIYVARGGLKYSELIWFVHRAHYNLYCLATHRRTIEQLAISAYSYCSKTERRRKALDERALSDFRHLLRLSKMFLAAEWSQDMIERAVSNRDNEFFRVISNAARKDVSIAPSEAAVEWLLVTLLWFLGGKDYDTRRQFLHDLHQNGILPGSVTEQNLNAELSRLGLTTTSI